MANVKKALEAIRSLTAPDSFLAPEAKTALHELRMKRASEQGFGDNYYHASQQDIDEFVPGYSDGLTFLTPDAKFANEWLGKGKFRGRQGAKDAEDVLYEEMRQWKRDYYDEFARKEGYKDFDDLYDKAPDAPLDELYDNIYKDKAKAFPVEIDDLGKTIYPVRSNVKNTFDPEKDIAVIDDYIDSIKGTNKELDRKIFEQGHYLAYENPEVVQHLKDKGYDSVSLRESTIMGNEKKPYTTLAVFDPKNIRSTNAQFLDPTSKKLLASAAGVAALSEDDTEAGVISKGGKKLIEAWHGTPHSFDKFDISKIGTGEGAQAYGHGLYSADSRSVGEGYRNALSGKYKYKGVEYPKNNIANATNDKGANEVLAAFAGTNGNIPEAKQVLRDRLKRYKDLDEEIGLGMKNENIPHMEDGIKRFDQILKDTEIETTGSLYKVEIDATPDELLDWDKPLSEQSDFIQGKFKEYKKESFEDELEQMQDYFNEHGPSGYGQDRFDRVLDEAVNHGGYGEEFGNSVWDELQDALPEYNTSRFMQQAESGSFDPSDTGEQFYRSIQSDAMGDAGTASDLLDAMNIKGIQYADGMSRGAEGGTKNYVIFNDKIMKIAKKYGVAPGAVTAGMLATEEKAEASEQYLSDIAGVAKENVLGLAGKGVDYLIDKWDEFNNAAKENLPPGLFNMLSTDWTGRQIREKPVEARNAILGGTTELLQDMGYDAQRNEHSKSDAEFGNKIDFIADLWQANPWTWFDGESK